MTSPPDHQQQNSPKKMGSIMFILAWLVLLAMLGLFFNDMLETQQNPNQNPANHTSMTGNQEVILQPNRQHHYVVSGLINNKEAVFLLDTGATDVVVPQQLAQHIGLNPGRKQYASTANGTVTVYSTILNSVKIGGIELQKISASINPAMEGNTVLLGMSALRQIEFSQRGDTLILRQ